MIFCPLKKSSLYGKNGRLRVETFYLYPDIRYFIGVVNVLVICIVANLT